MKAVQLQLCFLLLLISVEQITSNEVPNENEIQNNKINSKGLDLKEGSLILGNRLKRQTSTTTTQKPKKHRPSNIFSLISVLISETREDTNRAFNEIGTLFNSQFTDANSTTPKDTTSTTTQETPSSSSTEGDDEDNEITTTTEPFRISRDEFLGILRSNVQGLVQLFGKEFRLAVKDSNENVREFGRDLGLALRPYFN